MSKICIFGGTTEGRKLAEFISGQPLEAWVSVATDYGETLIDAADNVRVSVARLTAGEMTELFRRESFACVIDATHPYAAAVTENIAEACREADVEYIRLLREGDQLSENAVCVSDTAAAVEHINKYGSHHSDAILTRDDSNAQLFTANVDSAAVYVNASTRFTDGGEFGMGCEMGISTDKLHARGPVGIVELTTYKYVVTGANHIRK